MNDLQQEENWGFGPPFVPQSGSPDTVCYDRGELPDPPDRGQNEPPRMDLGREHRGGTKDTELNGRLSRYADARSRAVSMRGYLQEIAGRGSLSLARRVAEKLGNCGEYLRFRHYYTVGEVRLVYACFCRQHLVCPLCAIRRGARAIDRYLQRVDHVMREDQALTPWLMTLTVRNGEDLEERISHLRKSWKLAVQRRRDSARGKSSSVFGYIQGSVQSIEVTKKTQGWHPHLHAYVLSSQGFELNELGRCNALIQEWKEITGDSFIVDVRPVVGDQAEGLVEVLKYAVKFSSLSLSDNWHAFKTLRGSRLLGSLGCLYGVEIPETECDDIPEGELPFVDLLFRYVPSSRVYTFVGQRSPDLELADICGGGSASAESTQMSAGDGGA